MDIAQAVSTYRITLGTGEHEGQLVIRNAEEARKNFDWIKAHKPEIIEYIQNETSRKQREREEREARNLAGHRVLRGIEHGDLLLDWDQRMPDTNTIIQADYTVDGGAFGWREDITIPIAMSGADLADALGCAEQELRVSYASAHGWILGHADKWVEIDGSTHQYYRITEDEARAIIDADRNAAKEQQEKDMQEEIDRTRKTIESWNRQTSRPENRAEAREIEYRRNLIDNEGGDGYVEHIIDREEYESAKRALAELMEASK